jgi:serine phosphatase RsbU (regulator of sigma subunit)/ligand-binding sensor domain-containing protein
MHKNINLKYLLLAFVAILSVFTVNIIAQANRIIFEHISTKEGLSHRNVNCVMEDSYGFLWIGTADGLNRYDGYEFVVYKNDVWDTTSLSSPIISILTEDGQGNILVGTSEGLNLYQRHFDSFLRYTHDPKNEYSISDNNDINAIIIDRTNSNYIWIGTGDGGLILLDTELQRFYSFMHNPENQNSISGDAVNSLFQDSFGDFWIGTGDAGLNRINLNSIPVTGDGKYDVKKFSSIVFEHYLNEQEAGGDSPSTSVASIYEDRTNTIWILSRAGKLFYNRETNKLMPSPYFNSFQTSHLHEILEDRKGMIWFGGHNIVYKLNRNTNKIKEYKLNKEGTRGDNNQGLCEDNAGNIWAATWDGIVRLYRDTPLFEKHYHNVDDPSLPASSTMYSILADQSGKVWIGTYYGLLLMTKDKNGSVRFIDYSELYHFNPRGVRSIIEDHNGSIWAVIGYSLVRIDPKTNSIVQYKNDPENLNTLSFQNKQNKLGFVNLHIDDDNLWISTWGGGFSKVSLEELYLTKKLNDVEFTNYFSDANDPLNSISYFIQDRLGIFWICTVDAGVIKFNPETEIFNRYKQKINNPKSLSNNHTISVHEDKKGYIWIGTYGGGLNKFDRETESFTHYTSKNGLPSDIIQGILGDDNGNLWISTNSGISKFNPENNKLRNYEMEENEIYFHDTLTGKMYFGNDRGFNIFHPDSVKESNYVPPIVLTKFTRYSDENDGKQIIDRTISAKDNIDLSYKDDIISFEFVAISYNQNIKCEYSYILEGFNKNWINIGTKREVTFTNLDPGDYNFKVKACNEDGFWCDNFASIKIYISPPWWQTWWAYIVYLICFLSLLVGFRRFELTRRKEKEDKKILELENERKGKELEDARALQLSMLPAELPQISNLDIAAYMKTATEVGGDFYDFHLTKNGTLTAIIADATGHGMKAGMMVTATKSLFQNLAGSPDLKAIFYKFNECLYSMDLQPLLMSMLLVRLKEEKIEVINGGMPDLLIYRNKNKLIDEVKSSGPPLGAYIDYPYEKYYTEIESGDAIFSMSDGFAERFNENGEMIGYAKCKNIFKEVVNSNSCEIIDCLNKKGDAWAGSREQDDDITFVILKHK